jgi:regulator of cell morphogenesis and NO signaling
MNEPKDISPAALIEHILDRFHETHRRELPEILRLARLPMAQAAAPGLADQIEIMADALERHMFNEEMRLFPMMEQGGGILIGHLIENMQADHRSHADAIAELEPMLAGLPAPGQAPSPLGTLRVAVEKFIDDLRQHMHIEDDVLFPLFKPGGSRAA